MITGQGREGEEGGCVCWCNGEWQPSQVHTP